MEQDEDTDADSGRRSRGHLGVRADGAGAGAAGDDATGSVKLKTTMARRLVRQANPLHNRKDAPAIRVLQQIHIEDGFRMSMKFLLAIALLVLPAIAEAA